MYSFYTNKLNSLKSDSRFRKIKDIKQDGKYVIYNDERLLNLSSNDYLGISVDNNIKDNFLSKYKGKISNPSARLLGGTNAVFKELEEILAHTLNKQSALIFNSGYHANVGIYSSLIQKGDAVFIDRLNHASIIDGIHLSGADLIPFKHLDYVDLENKLQKYAKNYNKIIISSESLFSMDGDIADINELVRLKKMYGSILIIDEAHSFGVYGKGRGLCFEQGAMDDVDLIMATFGKAVGSYGAFAAGSKLLIDYLINYARSFIFSTSLPELSVSFSKYVIENHILNSCTLSDRLLNITDYTHNELKEKDVLGQSYIIPLVTGTNESAVLLSNKLIESGFYILPVRYPTVKKNTARIRISLNSSVNKDEINRLLSCL